ncbi:hypothetical protein WMY93_003222 [Mugilogobius chulae]|uniref:Uncharacterized protein n=1 Tax=Mugilogobius chulae TaxID=88201 RepID=A0AAW0PW04_9GOBI
MARGLNRSSKVLIRLQSIGSERWTSPDLSDRAEVPESRLQSGDCSLLIRDVQVTDGGQYNGYMILEPDQTRTRTETGVFICSVKLLVYDHSSVQTKRPGEDLLLDLFTPHSMTLRDSPVSPRVHKVPLKEQLSLKSVSESDQGIYKVLDQKGLTVSSTRLAVDPHASTALKFSVEDYTRGVGVKLVPSALLILTSVLTASLLFV